MLYFSSIVEKVNINKLVDSLRNKDLNRFKTELKSFTTASLNKSTIKNKEHDIEEYTIMELAIIHGQCEFVDALLEMNVNPNLLNGKERPLLMAARYGHHKILELFMKSNGKLNQECQINFDQSNSNGENVLHLGKCLKHFMFLPLS